MTETAKRELFTRQEEIGTLIEEFPLYIPVTKAAELLHMKPEALRPASSRRDVLSDFAGSWGTASPTRSRP